MIGRNLVIFFSLFLELCSFLSLGNISFHELLNFSSLLLIMIKSTFESIVNYSIDHLGAVRISPSYPKLENRITCPTPDPVQIPNS